MNELTVVAPATFALTVQQAEMAAALDFAMQEKSVGTRLAYDADWCVFTA